MSEETKATITYVVQMQRGVSRWMDEATDGAVATDAWQDIATVNVPPKTKRDTVIKAALKQAGIQPANGGDSLRLRALDGRSAEVTEAKPDAPDPQWELS